MELLKKKRYIKALKFLLETAQLSLQRSARTVKNHPLNYGSSMSNRQQSQKSRVFRSKGQKERNRNRREKQSNIFSEKSDVRYTSAVPIPLSVHNAGLLYFEWSCT